MDYKIGNRVLVARKDNGCWWWSNQSEGKCLGKIFTVIRFSGIGNPIINSRKVISASRDYVIHSNCLELITEDCEFEEED